MKIKIQVIATREIEISRDNYPTEWTDEEILKSEMEYADDLFHEWVSSDGVEFETEGEIMPED